MQIKRQKIVSKIQTETALVYWTKERMIKERTDNIKLSPLSLGEDVPGHT
jgi:hypothetical protein